MLMVLEILFFSISLLSFIPLFFTLNSLLVRMSANFRYKCLSAIKASSKRNVLWVFGSPEKVPDVEVKEFALVRICSLKSE